MWFNRGSHGKRSATRSLGLAIAGVAIVPATLLGISSGLFAVSSVTVSPGSLNVGQSSTGTVILSSAVRTSTTVNLSAEPTGIATVPASVTIGRLRNRADFTINTSAAGCAVIRASQGSTTPKIARLLVHSTSPQVTLTTDKEGSMLPATFRGTVTIPSPKGTTSTSLSQTVYLSVRPSGVAGVPRSVTIPSGQSSASFNITGTGYGCAVVTASYSGGTSSKALMIYPDG